MAAALEVQIVLEPRPASSVGVMPGSWASSAVRPGPEAAAGVGVPPVGGGEFVCGQAERGADVLGVVAVPEHRGGDGRVGGGGFGEHRISGRDGVGAGEVRKQPHEVVLGAG
ncbi:hypothetical protein ADK70_36930 [Streptomyces rimosus subsp. pseudoverticillatus]|nr:hypothetical protein ADK70_36930 [Streptomyces rimosus subsp. pseudoverticillatus]